MNQGILQLQSSPVQQMVASASNNWFSINGSSSLSAALPPNHIPHHLTPPPTAPLSWPTASQELPHSWIQPVLGFVGEAENKVETSHLQLQHRHMENWERQLLNNSGGAKQENSEASYGYYTGNLDQFTAAKSTNRLSPPIVSASPPKSCLTTSTMRNNEVFSFSDKSSKCNHSGINGVTKKPKINPTTSSQSGIKVRKEKLGDRIAALHQLVSPFGKTDTASVLLEAIGYIRFLQRQIEALTLPYFGTASDNSAHHQPAAAVNRERSCLFPEDPGQLLNENHGKRKATSSEECDEEAKKDLKRRGLCLVPLSSCTVDFGSENNGADYWAFGGSFQ